MEALSVPASASALALRLRRRKVDTLAALRAMELAGRVRLMGRGRAGRWHAVAAVAPPPVDTPKQKGETVSEDVQPAALAAEPIPDDGAARRERAQAALDLAAAEASERERERRRREAEQARAAQLAEDREASARGVANVCLAHYRGASRGRWWGPI